MCPGIYGIGKCMHIVFHNILELTNECGVAGHSEDADADCGDVCI